MTEPTDRELVDAYLKGGQDAALMQLIRRHQIPVFRQLSYELADPDDAESVCETVFVLAGRRLNEWKQTGEFRDWLVELAKEVGQSRQGEAIAADSPRLVDPAEFFRQSVHQALHTLDPEERSVLVAVELEGKSPEQVAQDNQMTVARVTEALERARSQFTETLSKPAQRDDAKPDVPVIRVSPGEIIDKRYKVEEVLGEGGMAKVFAAQHVKIKRRVAVKTLLPTRQAQAMVRERFVREAEVLGKLAHPNFVDVSDFGESSEGFAYLVMELLEGRPLSSALKEEGPMDPRRALRILREITLGLEFAHEQGVIHRDIKPDNVVLLDDETTGGFAKILDLGIAATDDEKDEKGPSLFGTPAYMAPEQIQGHRIDGRVDIYAMGVMLFELLTDDIPFNGSTVQYILVRHLSEPPPRLADVLEKHPPHLDRLQALIDRCMEKKAEDRFPNATALLEEIESVLEELGDDMDFPVAPRRSGHPPPRRSKSIAAPTPDSRGMPGWVWGVLVLGALGALVGWILLG